MKRTPPNTPRRWRAYAQMTAYERVAAGLRTWARIGAQWALSEDQAARFIRTAAPSLRAWRGAVRSPPDTYTGALLARLSTMIGIYMHLQGFYCSSRFGHACHRVANSSEIFRESHHSSRRSRERLGAMVLLRR